MPELTEFQVNIIEGSLLGDGYLSKAEGKSNSRFSKTQTISREEYLNWHFEMLLPHSNVIRNDIRFDKRTHKTYVSNVIETHKHLIFTQLRRKWYPSSVKRVPKDLKINAQILAIWFCDDGNSDPIRRKAFLHTQGFPREDSEYLSEALKELNINSSVVKAANSYQLYIGAKDYKNFIETIQPFVCWKCFSYKVDLKQYKDSRKNACTGVRFKSDKRSPSYGRWCAYIQVDKKMHYLGYFMHRDDAVAARKNAEIELRGQNA